MSTAHGRYTYLRSLKRRNRADVCKPAGQVARRREGRARTVVMETPWPRRGAGGKRVPGADLAGGAFFWRAACGRSPRAGAGVPCTGVYRRGRKVFAEMPKPARAFLRAAGASQLAVRIIDQIKSPLFILAAEPLTALPLITMATAPEEFFGKGLMEQSPPSPPVFPDDLPQKPNGSSESQHRVPNEMMLSYVSHVLMEDDDIDDKLNDHPALLQVQQPFAQILSSPSSGTNTGSREGSNDFLHEGNVDESELNSALSKGTDTVGAFLKGMEEANGLLPKDNFRRDELVNQMVRESSSHSVVKKRHSRDDHLQMEIRTSKAMTVIKEPEEYSANEMLDEMMLHGYKECIRDMDNLRVTMDNNEVEKKNRNSGSKETRDNNVVDIPRLMISCAQEVAVNNHLRARELLKQIMQHASETGDATQRLAQCFTKGLEARLVGTGSLLWELPMAERPSVVEFSKASSLYFEACCFNKVALVLSEMTIMHAMVGKSRLHIVDYGMQFGYQWAGLLHSLASREGDPPEHQNNFLELWNPFFEIKTNSLKFSFFYFLEKRKFHTIKTNWEDACIEDLNIEADEVLVVNDLFSFSTLMDDNISYDDLSPIVLNNISKMRPHVFMQRVYNCSYGSSFLSRFREMLFYYMALFDIFDATIQGRVNLECCKGANLVERPERYRQWQTRNRRAGLRQLPLKTSIVEVMKDMVMKHYHKDFLISQDGQWLLQGWRGRVHFAHSTWVAADVSSRGGGQLFLETVPGKYSELEVFGKCNSLPERQMLREEKRCLAVFVLTPGKKKGEKLKRGGYLGLKAHQLEPHPSRPYSLPLPGRTLLFLLTKISPWTSGSRA
ncbi:unnamed protein product [Miscanthus lutarioriparius]|uniref:Uncharacterized protein n=1 Tax=Miscanthus lutarioriparius TaxID=422564 RepID=A0A811RHQ6_9POAL|nr:unnamed protein product [Miscanthus lutarioriparius]